MLRIGFTFSETGFDFKDWSYNTAKQQSKNSRQQMSEINETESQPSANKWFLVER